MTGSTASESFAEFVCGTDIASFPEEVIEKAKLETLDVLGAIFGGQQTESGAMISRFVSQQAGATEATVVGSNVRVPCANAALANGTMAFVLGVDSGEHSSLSHITAPTLPAVLAVGEQRNISGEDFIVSFVLGYEIAVRIGRAIQPAHRVRGHWSISTFPTFGGAAAGAKALGLSARETVHALGLAGLQASGLGEIETAGTMGRQFMVGKSAQCAVISALLAEQGCTSPRTILEGDKGFCKVMADDYDSTKLTDRLGDSFFIMNGYNKPYPSCRYSHVVLDALFEVMKEEHLTSDNIEKIQVITNSITWDVCRSYEPLDFGAQPSPILSIPLTLAIAITNGSFSHADQTHFAEQVELAEVRDLAKRVVLVISPELDRQPLDKRGCRLEITTRDGRTIANYRDAARGDPSNPMTIQEVAENFLYYSVPALGDTRAREVVRLVSALEDLEDLSDLTDLL